MALVKRTYVDGETIITAQNLNDIQDEIISHANTFVPKTRTINSKALDANITLTASDLSAVPTTRTVNSKALSSNITLTAADVSAVPTTRTVNSKALSSNITLSASDVGAVPTTRKVNSKALSSDITLAAADIGYNSTTVDAALGSLNGAIDGLQDIAGDGSLSGFTATDLTGAANELKGSINSQQGQISAYIQTSTTASRAYAKGDYFVMNGVLYRVTTAIANGGTITIGTNAVATNVGAELNTTIKTLGFLKAGLSITGASTIGSFTLPAGEWLFLERVYASAAGEVALTINGGVSLHTNALNGSYVYGFNLATTNANTTFTYGTNSWTTATIGQLYVEVIPLLETRTSFS